VISPLINRLLPSVACSAFPACTLAGVSGTCAGGAACCGSGVGFGIDDPVWLGFHIALKVLFLFCPLLDWGCQGKANGSNPQVISPLAAAVAAAISCAAGNRSNQSSGSARMMRKPILRQLRVFCASAALQSHLEAAACLIACHSLWGRTVTEASISEVKERGATHTGCLLATSNAEIGNTGPAPSGCGGHPAMLRSRP
jgi:hypothetical protein